MSCKILDVKFINHPILGNLHLNFCDNKGKAVDTIILAGENGTGKSSIINALFEIISGNIKYELDLKVENNELISELKYRYENQNYWVYDDRGHKYIPNVSEFKKNYPLNSIYSDVDINFTSPEITNVTSLSLDNVESNLRSTRELPKLIKQLIIDIQALDDADISKAYRNNPNLKGTELNVKERMPRFTNAFNYMFDDLKYDSIENRSNKKIVYFKKNGVKIPIDSLSSGEKQIVYRGCFLLKDVNSMNGASVFIDEPEISLHPEWQKKILDFYKKIFTDKESGIQTSQIFVVTHSPFIIHNDNRKNDKVIVIKRSSSGEICVSDKPEYYKCNSVESIIDAFNINDFSNDVNCVYLEGRTDEKYFKRALEVFGYKELPIEFKWIGHMDNRNQEEFTGKSSLDNAYNFLKGQKLFKHHIFLYDCDTKHNNEDLAYLHTRVLPNFNNSKGMNKGIENALNLFNVDTEEFYEKKEKIDGYGAKSSICEFKKMNLCEHICSLDKENLTEIFSNLKPIVEDIINICSAKKS